MSDLISVIVPVYNSENCIDRCLLSILNQTHHNLEIILIDDCSTDKTLEKIDAYDDKRIVLLKNEVNKGQSAARNLGIDKSSGEFISFVDSDDYIDLDFYEKLLNCMDETQSDIAVAQTKYISSQKKRSVETQPITTSSYFEKLQTLKHGGAWDKLYRASLLKNHNIKFFEGRIWEDNLFVVQALYYADKLSVIDAVYYNYVYNNNSTTTSLSKFDKRKEDSLFIANEIMKFVKSKNVKVADVALIKTFILKNFITTKFLESSSYYKELKGIIGSSVCLLKMRIKAVKKYLFSFFFKKTKIKDKK